MKKETRNWTHYKQLPNLREVDFHWSDRDKHPGREYFGYVVNMEAVCREAFEAIQRAHADGVQWLLLTHGSSTSRRGATTARSQIRGLIRSKDTTPFIVRSQCIQHPSVMVVAIRRKNPA